MTVSLDNSSTIAARELVASMVRLHGRKRGLSAAADRLGVSESWARKIHYGEASAISQQVAERAMAAWADVLRARLLAARREIEAIEGELRGHILECADARGVSVVGNPR